jgi:hypothetical protein
VRRGRSPGPLRTDPGTHPRMGYNPSPLSSLLRRPRTPSPRYHPRVQTSRDGLAPRFHRLARARRASPGPVARDRLSRWSNAPSPRCGLRVAPALWVLNSPVASQAPISRGRPTPAGLPRLAMVIDPDSHVDQRPLRRRPTSYGRVSPGHLFAPSLIPLGDFPGKKLQGPGYPSMYGLSRLRRRLCRDLLARPWI